MEPGEPDPEGQMRHSVEASLERLQRSRVDVLWLHNQILADDSATEEGPRGIHISRVLGKGGIADAMNKLRSEGICDHIGYTSLGEAPGVVTVADSGAFDAVQAYYNMINPSAGWASAPAGWNSMDFAGLLEATQKRDLGVMTIRIFAAGHLATKVRHGREWPVTENSSNEAEEAWAEAVWAALRFGLGNAALSTIEVGMAQMEHLEQALAAEAAGPLPEECAAQLRKL